MTDEKLTSRLLLKADEAAQMLGIGRGTVYAMMNDGTLPTVRMGRAVRIPLDALRRWIEGRTNA